MTDRIGSNPPTKLKNVQKSRSEQSPLKVTSGTGNHNNNSVKYQTETPRNLTGFQQAVAQEIKGPLPRALTTPAA